MNDIGVHTDDYFYRIKITRYWEVDTDAIFVKFLHPLLMIHVKCEYVDIITAAHQSINTLWHGSLHRTLESRYFQWWTIQKLLDIVIKSWLEVVDPGRSCVAEWFSNLSHLLNMSEVDVRTFLQFQLTQCLIGQFPRL